MAITNSDTKVITGVVRLSYAHLFEPSAMQGQDPKYSCTIMIPKDDKETIGKIKKAFKAAAEAGKAKFNGKVPANLATTLHDADTDTNQNGEVYAEVNPEYAGHYIMSLSSKNKPGIIDRDKNEITDSSQVYSGCYARVSLNCFAYNVSGKKGLSAGLNNVQKIKDGDYFGGRTRAEDDFDEYEADDYSDSDDLL